MIVPIFIVLGYVRQILGRGLLAAHIFRTRNTHIFRTRNIPRSSRTFPKDKKGN